MRRLVASHKTEQLNFSPPPKIICELLFRLPLPELSVGIASLAFLLAARHSANKLASALAPQRRFLKKAPQKFYLKNFITDAYCSLLHLFTLSFSGKGVGN